MEGDPHRLLEAVLLAAFAAGASRAILYINGEAALSAARVAVALEQARAWGLVGPQVLGSDLSLEVEIRRGAGGFVLGEETALLESIEGQRAMPRTRPPFPVESGLFGKPTVINNVETLSAVPSIVERGGAWFASHGRRGRSGLRRFSVSGRVATPGIYLAPAGITARELIDEYAGGMEPGDELQAYLPGGASGGILPASLADLPLDFDTLAEHGAFVGSMAVVVLGRHDLARDAASSLMRFFEHESCGQCTPCREGTMQASRLMAEPRWNTALMAELSAVMRDASICGLGQAAPNPMDSVIRFFPHEVQP